MSSAKDHWARDLARTIAGPGGGPANYLWGTVTASTDTTVTATIQGTSVSGIPLVGPEPAFAGDDVLILDIGGYLVCLGPVGVAPTPANYQFVATSLTATNSTTTPAEDTACRHTVPLPDGWTSMKIASTYAFTVSLPAADTGSCWAYFLVDSTQATNTPGYSNRIQGRSGSTDYATITWEHTTGAKTAGTLFSVEFIQAFGSDTISAVSLRAHHEIYRLS